MSAHINDSMSAHISDIMKKMGGLADFTLVKELYETCIAVGFDINNMTNFSFGRGNLKKFITILKSDEFKQYPHLFTSTTLAHSTPERIQDILSMKEWEDERYKHLLTSTILTKRKENISRNIEIAEKYNIENYIYTNYLIKSPSQNYALVNYLLDNNMSVVQDGKLSGIFSYQPGALLKKIWNKFKRINEAISIRRREGEKCG